MVRKVFLAGGPGDVVSAHKYWANSEQDPGEVSIGFSSQVEQFCKEIGASLLVIAYNNRRDYLIDGSITLEHRPKPFRNSSGILYHFRELLYCLSLLKSVVLRGSDVALIESGTTHHFFLILFRLFGIPVVPILYNTLWASGFPPTNRSQKLIMWLDSLFWRYIPAAILCISPECARQVNQLTRGRSKPLVQVRAQFEPDFFKLVPPPPPHESRPFRIMYIGRVISSKGVFDILEMARTIEDQLPGQVRWDLCGRGPDFEELKLRHMALKLENVVQLHGWVSRIELAEVYRAAHAAIVPTRSTFAEGLAMTAVEAILCGRPVITSPVVPALEVLEPACIAAKTDDVPSFVSAIVRLQGDKDLYNQKQNACRSVGECFYDRSCGLTSVLKRVAEVYLGNPVGLKKGSSD